MTAPTRSRIDEVFDRVIDLDGEARTRALDEACGTDATLRAAIERLLRADARAGVFMERPPAQVAALIDEAAGAPRQFGPYRVLRSLGAGGMGQVWLAERSDGEFEHRVAIKQLAYPTPGLLHRFRQERQILARLEHQNIARLIDGGVGADGGPYFVMEYVDGVPITTYARDHALDVPTVLRLFLRVCDAVQFAHQNLVVHRDLKPLEHLYHGGRNAKAPRLRHRQAADDDRRRRADANRGEAADAGLRRARAVHRSAGDDGDRCVCARRRVVRAPCRDASRARRRGGGIRAPVAAAERGYRSGDEQRNLAPPRAARRSRPCRADGARQ